MVSSPWVSLALFAGVVLVESEAGMFQPLSMGGKFMFLLSPPLSSSSSFPGSALQTT